MGAKSSRRWSAAVQAPPTLESGGLKCAYLHCLFANQTGDAELDRIVRMESGVIRHVYKQPVLYPDLQLLLPTGLDPLPGAIKNADQDSVSRGH